MAARSGSGFFVAVFVACAGWACTAAGPSVADDSPAGSSRPIAEPLPPGSACADDSECVLSTWICDPCGLCPGAHPRAVSKQALEAERRACRWEQVDSLKSSVACSPCPPGEAFVPKYAAKCVDRKCVRVP